jgi:hypothetical protein
MTELSTAAQSVLDALCMDELNGSQQLVARAHAAAALRAAALHLHAEEEETCGGCSCALMIEVDDLLSLADEIESL